VRFETPQGEQGEAMRCTCKCIIQTTGSPIQSTERFRAVALLRTWPWLNRGASYAGNLLACKATYRSTIKVAAKRPSNGTRAWRRPYRDVSMANALFTCQPSTCNVKPSPHIVKTQMRLCGENRPRVGMERAVLRLPRPPPCPGCDY
jgi:hypothetical protein